MALDSFLARPKPKNPFLYLSLLRNQTETLATQARARSVKSSLRGGRKKGKGREKSAKAGKREESARLRVVPHLSTVIVERAKREHA